MHSLCCPRAWKVSLHMGVLAHTARVLCGRSLLRLEPGNAHAPHCVANVGSWMCLARAPALSTGACTPHALKAHVRCDTWRTSPHRVRCQERAVRCTGGHQRVCSCDVFALRGECEHTLFVEGRSCRNPCACLCLGRRVAERLLSLR